MIHFLLARKLSTSKHKNQDKNQDITQIKSSRETLTKSHKRLIGDKIVQAMNHSELSQKVSTKILNLCKQN